MRDKDTIKVVQELFENSLVAAIDSIESKELYTNVYYDNYSKGILTVDQIFYDVHDENDDYQGTIVLEIEHLGNYITDIKMYTEVCDLPYIVEIDNLYFALIDMIKRKIQSIRYQTKN